MSQYSAQMQTTLATPAPTIFGAVEILLPGHALRLLDGSAQLSFGGNTYVGRDATFGVLAAIEEISDGAGEEAPAVSITLLPASDAAAAALASPAMQGSQVSIWLGAVDPTTGTVIPDPLLLFLGEVDVPRLRSSANSRELELEVVSSFERFFADDEGARLAPEFHKSIWPGELGLDFVTGIEETVYWGVDGPKPSITTGGGGGGGDFDLPWRRFMDAL